MDRPVTQGLHYADYLQLSKILTAQNRESEKQGRPCHDEMLFIIIHQTYELWFKQIHFELDSLLDVFSQKTIREGQMGTLVRRLHRINEILRLLVDQFTVLETMTPLEFLEFRDLLAPASGFQSVQFRKLEMKLGLSLKGRPQEWPRYILAQLTDEERKELMELENKKSLKENLVTWLERMPFLQQDGYNFWQEYSGRVESLLDREKQHILGNTDLPQEEKARQLAEWQKNHEHFQGLIDPKLHENYTRQGLRSFSHRATLSALFILLYRDEPLLFLPHEFLMNLMDLDEYLASWRSRHALMAHRMLGSKVGTGGSLGHQYLKSTSEGGRLFQDLFNLSTFLIPRSNLPALPSEVKDKLNFHFQGAQ